MACLDEIEFFERCDFYAAMSFPVGFIGFIIKMENRVGSIRLRHDHEAVDSPGHVSHPVLGKNGITGFQRFSIFVNVLGTGFAPVPGIMTPNEAVEIDS